MCTHKPMQNHTDRLRKLVAAAVFPWAAVPKSGLEPPDEWKQPVMCYVSAIKTYVVDNLRYLQQRLLLIYSIELSSPLPSGRQLHGPRKSSITTKTLRPFLQKLLGPVHLRPPNSANILVNHGIKATTSKHIPSEGIALWSGSRLLQK